MNIQGQELIQIKKTKFVDMAYDTESKELYCNIFEDDMVRLVKIPINKIPQVIRGLFSAYQRYYRKHENRKENKRVDKSEKAS
jgi:hypothetical protein